jgi:hypothetical protein
MAVVKLGYYGPNQAASDILEMFVDPEEITIHRDFNSTGVSNNDIALMELAYPVGPTSIEEILITTK